MPQKNLTVQLLEKMADDFKDALSRNEELGLNPYEIAFYDTLAERPEVMKTMGDATLKQLATEQLRASTTVDSQVRGNVRAKMRVLKTSPQEIQIPARGSGRGRRPCPQTGRNACRRLEGRKAEPRVPANSIPVPTPAPDAHICRPGGRICTRGVGGTGPWAGSLI